VATTDSIWIVRYEMNGQDFISLPRNERNPTPPLQSCLPTVFTSLCIVVAHFSLYCFCSLLFSLVAVAAGYLKVDYG
jgi:hypothetical protein